jgi:uncharacterized protein YbcI
MTAQDPARPDARAAGSRRACHRLRSQVLSEKRDHAADEMTQRNWAEGLSRDPSGSMRSEISNAMVGLKKQFYGKGPTSVKTYINDHYVFCVMKGGLTRNEETLLEAGEAELVRSYRLRFQEAMAGPTTESVERITGRRVLTYHSQIVFDPEHAVEFFVLDEAPSASVEKT